MNNNSLIGFASGLAVAGAGFLMPAEAQAQLAGSYEETKVVGDFNTPWTSHRGGTSFTLLTGVTEYVPGEVPSIMLAPEFSGRVWGSGAGPVSWGIRLYGSIPITTGSIGWNKVNDKNIVVDEVRALEASVRLQGGALFGGRLRIGDFGLGAAVGALIYGGYANLSGDVPASIADQGLFGVGLEGRGYLSWKRYSFVGGIVHRDNFAGVSPASAFLNPNGVTGIDYQVYGGFSVQIDSAEHGN